MTQEDKKKFYRMMVLFTGGCFQSRDRLRHSFPDTLIDEAISNGLIEKLYEDEYGVPIYGITHLGKEAWE